MATSLPLVIQSSIALLAAFLDSHAVVFGRSGNRHKKMRSDRKNNILGVAIVMLRGCCLQHQGVICHFSGIWVRPMTIAEIATLAKICPKTVTRCIADLVDLGLVETKQIKRKNPKTGLLEVSIGIRKFTDKFWRAIGLLDFYRKSCLYAKGHCKRILLMPFKAVKLAEKTVSQAAEVVGEVMKNLTEGAARAQFWCNKIIHDIRQKK